MQNFRGAELTLFIGYTSSAPAAEVAEILTALEHAVHEFHRGLGLTGVTLEIRDARVGSIRFWLGLAGVALPAAKLEADYPGTVTRFLELLKIGAVMSAEATVPSYVASLLGLCARPVAEGRADETTIGSTHDDGPGIRIGGGNAITIVNHYYYGATTTSPAAGMTHLVGDTAPAAPNKYDDASGGDAPPRVDQHQGTEPSSPPTMLRSASGGIPPTDDDGDVAMRRRAAGVDWSVHESSGRDVLIGLDLDVGERTGTIVARDILKQSMGLSDIGGPKTTGEERQRFEKAVRHALVTDRAFHRTRFNDRAVTAMRLDADDFD